MEKKEQADRLARALAALEIAAAAVSHAERTLHGVAGLTRKDTDRVHDAIGKLQMKAQNAYARAWVAT